MSATQPQSAIRCCLSAPSAAPVARSCQRAGRALWHALCRQALVRRHADQLTRRFGSRSSASDDLEIQAGRWHFRQADQEGSAVSQARPGQARESASVVSRTWAGCPISFLWLTLTMSGLPLQKPTSSASPLSVSLTPTATLMASTICDSR